MEHRPLAVKSSVLPAVKSFRPLACKSTLPPALK
jgi:hypothetical protein